MIAGISRPPWLPRRHHLVVRPRISPICRALALLRRSLGAQSCKRTWCSARSRLLSKHEIGRTLKSAWVTTIFLHICIPRHLLRLLYCLLLPLFALLSRAFLRRSSRKHISSHAAPVLWRGVCDGNSPFFLMGCMGTTGRTTLVYEGRGGADSPISPTACWR